MRRSLKVGDSGLDVEAAKRSVLRARGKGELTAFVEKPDATRRKFQAEWVAKVKQIQKVASLPQTGMIGDDLLGWLRSKGFVDAFSERLFKIVFVCVGNDDDLRSVVLGPDGALAGMRAGSVLVDHTTASADVAREIGALAAAKGVGFVDAPVSGGFMGAHAYFAAAGFAAAGGVLIWVSLQLMQPRTQEAVNAPSHQPG